MITLYHMLRLEDFQYDLPPDRIPLHPLPRRDEAKFLVYRQGTISHHIFQSLPGLLDENSVLFFNQTKVIPARLTFKKDTGAEIEVFLLQPVEPAVDMSLTLQATDTTTWQCAIGNAKRWTHGKPLVKQFSSGVLRAELVSREKGLVKFTWDPASSFAQVIQHAGILPLPPYLKRAVEPSDHQRYQTIYSIEEGAVAAPTAGLHFTDDVFRELDKRNIRKNFLTLHVGAGTFQPIKSNDPLQHQMHAEHIVVTQQTIEDMIRSHRHIIAVGTTSMRTLESLYWYGVKLHQDPHADFVIGQKDPYEKTVTLEFVDALENVLQKMNRDGKESLAGETSIYIHPGYRFRVCNGLITNFHQPGSTLLLLIAAFIGEDWRKVYREAMTNGYRFLSYGDSSLLIP